MRRRLEERLVFDAFGAADRGAVLAAYDLAMERRLPELGDEHFDSLHPGRTLRILLQDAVERDPIALAVAALLDSWEPRLRPDAAEAALTAWGADPDRAGRIAHARAATPLPPDGALLEELVVCPPPLLRAAVAEALDHMRHLHLHPRDQWRERWTLIETCYRPAATRAHPKLAARIARSCDVFRERFLR